MTTQTRTRPNPKQVLDVLFGNEWVISQVMIQARKLSANNDFDRGCFSDSFHQIPREDMLTIAATLGTKPKILWGTIKWLEDKQYLWIRRGKRGHIHAFAKFGDCQYLAS